MNKFFLSLILISVFSLQAADDQTGAPEAPEPETLPIEQTHTHIGHGLWVKNEIVAPIYVDDFLDDDSDLEPLMPKE